MPHSTVQKEDSNRKETMKRLIQQFENHPNRCSFTQDLNKTEEFNPLSEKSKELITSMGNTEYFELRETSSKIQLGMSNTTSLCQISGGLKHKFNNMTHLHWKIIPTWLHLKKEVVKQRPVTNEATQKCIRLYSEHVQGNSSIHPAQQTRHRNQKIEGLDEYNYTVDPRNGWRFTRQPDQQLRLLQRTGSSTTVGSRTEVGIRWRSSTWTEQ